MVHTSVAFGQGPAHWPAASMPQPRGRHSQRLLLVTTHSSAGSGQRPPHMPAASGRRHSAGAQVQVLVVRS
jgi:hypothetical protein